MTYVLFKDSDLFKDPSSLDDACDKGLKAVDEFCTNIEDNLERFVETVEKARDEADRPSS